MRVYKDRRVDFEGVTLRTTDGHTTVAAKIYANLVDWLTEYGEVRWRPAAAAEKVGCSESYAKLALQHAVKIGIATRSRDRGRSAYEYAPGPRTHELEQLLRRERILTTRRFSEEREDMADKLSAQFDLSDDAWRVYTRLARVAEGSKVSISERGIVDLCAPQEGEEEVWKPLSKTSVRRRLEELETLGLILMEKAPKKTMTVHVALSETDRQKVLLALPQVLAERTSFEADLVQFRSQCGPVSCPV